MPDYVVGIGRLRRGVTEGRQILRFGYRLSGDHGGGHTGIGMPPEIQKKIFELNFTTKTEKGKGLGFGLWWVRNFVRRARGDISIRSSPGEGTEVTIKIPIDRPDGGAQAGAK